MPKFPVSQVGKSSILIRFFGSNRLEIMNIIYCHFIFVFFSFVFSFVFHFRFSIIILLAISNFLCFQIVFSRFFQVLQHLGWSCCKIGTSPEEISKNEKKKNKNMKKNSTFSKFLSSKLPLQSYLFFLSCLFI